MDILFFQNSYAIFAHILQHYHDFQSNVALFPKVVQAYTQTYLLGGRIKQISCQSGPELSVTIHKISTSWTLDGEPNTICGEFVLEVGFTDSLCFQKCSGRKWNILKAAFELVFNNLFTSIRCAWIYCVSWDTYFFFIFFLFFFFIFIFFYFFLFFLFFFIFF